MEGIQESLKLEVEVKDIVSISQLQDMWKGPFIV